MSVVMTKRFPEPPLREKEIWRYARCGKPEEETEKLLLDVLGEIRGRLSYQVCYCELPVTLTEAGCDLGCFSVSSQALSKALRGCDRVLLFGATLGVELDRQIARYGRISPAKALILQAVGAERIEALCDEFCGDYEAEHGVSLRPRFSAGYGDCPLETQRDIFTVLNCAKHIGLCLTDSLLMSPSKSVTAFAGILRGAET